MTKVFIISDKPLKAGLSRSETIEKTQAQALEEIFYRYNTDHVEFVHIGYIDGDVNHHFYIDNKPYSTFADALADGAISAKDAVILDSDSINSLGVLKLHKFIQAIQKHKEAAGEEHLPKMAVYNIGKLVQHAINFRATHRGETGYETYNPEIDMMRKLRALPEISKGLDIQRIITEPENTNDFVGAITALIHNEPHPQKRNFDAQAMVSNLNQYTTHKGSRRFITQLIKPRPARAVCEGKESGTNYAGRS